METPTYALDLGYCTRVADSPTAWEAVRGKRILVLFFVPASSIKYGCWSDGFTKALELVSSENEVLMLNVGDLGDKENWPALEEFDHVLVKSNWGWIVDRYARSMLAGVTVPRTLLISGTAKPPIRAIAQFYDGFVYETPWYGQFLLNLKPATHAFGVDTTVMKPDEDAVKYWDHLAVGSIVRHKRPLRMLELEGRRLMVGDLKASDMDLVNQLRAGGVTVRDYVGYRELATLYNSSSSVQVFCELGGGGERAVLEARACGIPVTVANDNPNLQQLVEIPTVWSHSYYASKLLEAISSAEAAVGTRPNRSRLETMAYACRADRGYFLSAKLASRSRRYRAQFKDHTRFTLRPHE